LQIDCDGDIAGTTFVYRSVVTTEMKICQTLVS
jgi:hypothetical protein